MNQLLKSITIVWVLLPVFSCQTDNAEKVAESSENDYYQEPHRPQFHFSPKANWMNDPNGMVYFDGEYHLFYQYYPDSTVWGPMHWGHAVSTDLVHWEHLPVALEPDDLGWIFSGSAVFDVENTSGLGTDENPPLVAIYTYHDPVGADAGRDDFQTQGIAFSLDKGRSWEKYRDNPVLDNPGIRDFRDPKVSKMQVGGQDRWIMSLAVKDKISFYSSEDLLQWTHESDFNPPWAAYGGVWECPDLFPLTAPDGQEKWVLLVSINPGGPNGGSATQYFIGDFDGQLFSTDQKEIHWLDYGADNYAGVTWSNIPASDGRRLFIGWMSNWLYANVVPTEVWRSATTLPRELALWGQSPDWHLASRPVKELEKLRKSSHQISGDTILLEEELVELVLTPDEETFRIVFNNSEGEQVILEKEGEMLILDRKQSGLVDFNERFPSRHQAPLGDLAVQRIRIYLDRSSIEVFINEGEMVLTDLLFPEHRYSHVELKGFADENRLHYLPSIW